MNMQENYEQLIAPYRVVHNYREQAEKIALEIFQSLDEIQITSFFDFFKKVCKEKSSTYQFFLKRYQEIQQGSTTLSSKQMRYLLSAILAFALPAQQALLLRLELCDYLQKQKIAITHNFSLQVNVQGAFDCYSKYLASMYYLGRMSSNWFAEASFLTEDRRQVTEAVMYVYVAKLKISVSHFKKDVELIASKARNLSKKMTYFLDLLGIEVGIAGKHYDLNHLYAYDEMHLPTFAGKLAEPLKAYLTEEFESEDYQLVLREMQETVLAHDLGVAIQHYKNNNTLNSRADISLALQGGAGVVRLEIRSWVNRLLMFTDKKNLTIIAVIGMLLAVSLIEPNFFKFAVYIAIFIVTIFSGKRANSEKEEEEQARIQHNLDLAYLREPIEQQYRQIVGELQAEQGYVLLNQGFIEEMAYNLHAELRRQALAMYAITTSTTTPIYTQYLFSAYHQLLAGATQQNMGIVQGYELDIEDREAILEVVRYVLEQRYFKARVHFNHLMKLIMRYRIEAKYYLYFLGVESIIYPDFYGYEQDFFRAGDFWVYASRNYSPTLKFLTPMPKGKYAEQLNVWLAQEMADIEQSNVETELAQVTEYLQFLEKSQNTPYLNIAPLLLEGESGILYI